MKAFIRRMVLIPLLMIAFPIAVLVSWLFSEKNERWFQHVENLFREAWTGELGNPPTGEKGKK